MSSDVETRSHPSCGGDSGGLGDDSCSGMGHSSLSASGNDSGASSGSSGWNGVVGLGVGGAASGGGAGGNDGKGGLQFRLLLWCCWRPHLVLKPSRPQREHLKEVLLGMVKMLGTK